MSGTLYAVGVGPGDPELMTIKALRVLERADVIACPAKENAPGTAFEIAEKAYPAIAGKKLLLLDIPMKKGDLSDAHKKAAEQISDKLQSGMDVAFLTLGDPQFYSSVYYITDIVAAAGHEIRIVNGIPSFCAASAMMRKPLSLGDGAVLITSGEYRAFDGTLVIMKAGSRICALKEAVIRNGKDACLIENCGMDDERIYCGIAHIPDSAGYFSILIVQ